MKVRYVFPLDRPMQIEDHWPIPILGGTLRLLDEDGLVAGLEFEKSGLPTRLSLQMQNTPDSGLSAATIHGRDDFLPLVRDHIHRAFSYLQCFFDTSISVDEVKVFYEPESEEEKDEIDIPWMHFGRQERRPLPLTYDFLTRAMMAAEGREGPEFVASLAKMSRESFGQRRYIDSFRFSFLLIEALYGKGKFKTKQLQHAFASSPPLIEAVQQAIRGWSDRGIKHASDTLTLMRSNPAPEKVIDHLISMRGHYFHGNIDKKDSWHPGKQEEVEALAWLGIDIVQKIAGDAALPMFANEFSKRHFDEAGAAGAHLVMEIEYKFRVPEDEFIRVRKINFRMPGTKATTTIAMEAAYRAIENFRQSIPVGRLHSVSGREVTGGQQLFEIRFFTEEEGTVVKG